MTMQETSLEAKRIGGTTRHTRSNSNAPESSHDMRRHAGIGCVTPDDEHNGKGETIRHARQDGLARADEARRAA